MTNNDERMQKRPEVLIGVLVGVTSLHLTGCVDPMQSVAPPEVRSWLLIAAVVVVLGMSMLMLRRRNATSSAMIQRMESTIRSLQSEVGAAQQELESALDQVRMMNDELQEHRSRATTSERHHESIGTEYAREMHPRTSTTTLYLTTPEADGTFDDQLRSSHYVAGESMYVLTLDPAKQSSASFELIMHRDALDLALRRRERFVEPYCETANAYRSSVVGVETIVPGTMELSGGAWRVVKKATIKYL